MSVESIGKVAFDVIYEDNVEIVYKVAAKILWKSSHCGRDCTKCFHEIVYEYGSCKS